MPTKTTKTAPKSGAKKKPTQAERIEGIELALQRHEARMNEHTRIRARQKDEIDNRLTALEQAAIELTLPHILSLMARVKHADDCESLEGPDYAPMGDTYVPVPNTEPPCSCGLDAELKSIESLIHQTT